MGEISLERPRSYAISTKVQDLCATLAPDSFDRSVVLRLARADPVPWCLSPNPPPKPGLDRKTLMEGQSDRGVPGDGGGQPVSRGWLTMRSVTLNP